MGKTEVMYCAALTKDDALIIQPYPVRATKIQSDCSGVLPGFNLILNLQFPATKRKAICK